MYYRYLGTAVEGVRADQGKIAALLASVLFAKSVDTMATRSLTSLSVLNT